MLAAGLIIRIHIGEQGGIVQCTLVLHALCPRPPANASGLFMAMEAGHAGMRP